MMNHELAIVGWGVDETTGTEVIHKNISL